MGQSCSSDEEEQGGLCYKKCREGYTGNAAICYGNCPTNTTDIGLTCSRHSYNRGGGTIPDRCKRDEDRIGFLCCKKSDKLDCRDANCPDGKEKEAGLCYHKCREGFEGTLTVCSARCSGETVDTGIDCLKKEYGRGVGRIPENDFRIFWIIIFVIIFLIILVVIAYFYNAFK